VIQEQKLKVEKVSDAQVTCLRMSGTIDEQFDGKKLAATVKGGTLVLDLGEVRKISSFGCREWVDFVGDAGQRVNDLLLVECAPKVVDQLNMVSQFLGAKGLVFSFYAPYRCDYCDIDRRVLFQVDRDAASIRSLRPSEQLCETCSRPSYFDEEPASFFAYLAQQRPFELSPAIAEFLSSKLRYSVTGGDRRLHIDKHIEGRNTYLKFVGNLDGSFPSGKIAEGLEGTIVVDVSGIGTIDLAGAAEWRNFITQTKATAERVFLVGCPPVLLERLTRQGDLGDQVISFTMPYSCSKCATTASQLIDVEQHYDILKFATPPEMKCSHCKSPTVCVAPESLLSRLRTLPRVEMDSGLRKFVKEMRDRKPERPQAPKVPGAVTGARLGMFTGLIVLALVAAAVLIGVNWYQTREARETQKKIEGAIAKVEGSQEAVQRSFTRPVWITSDTPSTASCIDNVNRLSCVGISSYSDNREQARIEAGNAAMEEMVNSIGLKIEDADFQQKVRPLYDSSRSKALSDLENLRGKASSAEQTKALEAVRNARKAVAEALVATGGSAAPTQQAAWYWEEFEKMSGPGTEFLVFVRYDISLTALKSLTIAYSDEVDAGGSKVVTMFPGIAWQRPDARSGALVLRPSGLLQRLGVREFSVVTAAGGEPVRTANELAARLRSKKAAKLEVVAPDGAVKQLGD